MVTRGILVFDTLCVLNRFLSTRRDPVHTLDYASTNKISLCKVPLRDMLGAVAQELAEKV